MKKILLISAALMLLQSCIGAGENSEISAVDEVAQVKKATAKVVKENFFPRLVGADLQGNQRQLPQSFSGKINLVAVAFMHKQQSDVNSWLPIFTEMAKQNQQIKFYEVPLLSERNALRRVAINNGMRSGVKDEVARARTITVYTNREKFFALTNMREENITILAVDDAGKILCRVDGPATPEKVKRLRSQAKL